MALFRRREGRGSYGESSPFSQPGFIASALFVGFIVILAVVIGVTGPGGSSQSASSASPSGAARGQLPDLTVTITPSQVPGSSGSPASPGANANGCPAISDGSQSVPAAPPAGVNWQIYNTLALPFSTAAGPFVIKGDIARCYQHSPTGALIALAQIDVRYFVARDWQGVTQQQVVQNAGEQVYYQSRTNDELANGHRRAPGAGELSQLTGFKFVSYDSNSAVIEIARKSNTGDVTATLHTMVWSGGDWLLQLQPDGSDTATSPMSVNLTDVVMWGGV